MAQFTWEVRRDGDTWKVFREGVRVLQRESRDACVEYVRREAAVDTKFFGSASRLLVNNEDGTVDEEVVGDPGA